MMIRNKIGLNYGQNFLRDTGMVQLSITLIEFFAKTFLRITLNSKQGSIKHGTFSERGLPLSGKFFVRLMSLLKNELILVRNRKFPIF